MTDLKTLLVIGVGVLGCFGVRYLPFLLKNAKFPPTLERYLQLVVPAALGALIFPSVLVDFSGHAWVGVAGVLAAGVYSFFRGGLVVPVLIAFAVSFAGLSLF